MSLPAKLLSSKKLALIIVLSAVGGISSVLVGYAGGFLSFIPLGSPVAGQLLAGLHVLWLILVAVLTKIRGAATMAGAVKGTVEMFLPNHLGFLVFFMSLFEGLIIDLSLLSFGGYKRLPILFGSGLSSASNVVVLQVFQILPATLPPQIYLGMYAASFCSGLVLGGYLGVKTLGGLRKFLPNI